MTEDFSTRPLGLGRNDTVPNGYNHETKMSGPVEIAEVFLYDDAGGGAFQVIRQSDGDFFGEN